MEASDVYNELLKKIPVLGKIAGVDVSTVETVMKQQAVFDLKIENKYVYRNMLPWILQRIITVHFTEEQWERVEWLALQRLIKVGYLQLDDLRHVHALNDDWCKDKTPAPVADEEELLHMVLYSYKLWEHYRETIEHRDRVIQTASAMVQSGAVDARDVESVRIHDLSKFSFALGIGYTMRWVHGNKSSLTAQCINHHLQNEPHHHDFWDDPVRAKEKLLKLVGDKRMMEILNEPIDTKTPPSASWELLHTTKMAHGIFPWMYFVEAVVDKCACEWRNNCSDSTTMNKVMNWKPRHYLCFQPCQRDEFKNLRGFFKKHRFNLNKTPSFTRENLYSLFGDTGPPPVSFRMKHCPGK